MLVDIEDKKGKLARDTNSLAIISVDKEAAERHRIIRDNMKKEEEMRKAINSLNDEVSSIKSDISKILELLNSRGS